MPQFLSNLLALLGASRYIILFVGTIVEGPVVMLTSGFLYRLGQFDLVPMYIALMLGDFVADVGWYWVGYHGAGPIIKRFGKYLNITPAIIVKIEKRFKKYQTKILIISKLTMGLGFALATLIVAGILRVDFKKYIILNLLGGFIWTALLIVVGYFFGNIYELIGPRFKIAFAGFVAAAVIAALYYGNKFLVKKET